MNHSMNLERYAPLPARGSRLMEWAYIVSYLQLAALAAACTFALLFVTKSPLIVTTVSASLAACADMLYARLDLGYWDKFVVVASIVSWLFAFVVSFAFMGIGRLLKHPFFLDKK